MQLMNSGEKNARLLSMYAVRLYLCVTVTNWDLHKACEQ